MSRDRKDFPYMLAPSFGFKNISAAELFTPVAFPKPKRYLFDTPRVVGYFEGSPVVRFGLRTRNHRIANSDSFEEVVRASAYVVAGKVYLTPQSNHVNEGEDISVFKYRSLDGCTSEVFYFYTSENAAVGLIGKESVEAMLDAIGEDGTPLRVFAEATDFRRLVIQWRRTSIADDSVVQFNLRDVYGLDKDVWVDGHAGKNFWSSGKIVGPITIILSEFFRNAGCDEDTFDLSSRWAKLYMSHVDMPEYEIKLTEIFNLCNFIFPSTFAVEEVRVGKVIKVESCADEPLPCGGIRKPMYTFGSKRYIGFHPTKGDVYAADLNLLEADGSYQRDCYLLSIAGKTHIVPLRHPDEICQSIAVEVKGERKVITFQSLQSYFCRKGNGLPGITKRLLDTFPIDGVFPQVKDCNDNPSEVLEDYLEPREYSIERPTDETPWDRIVSVDNNATIGIVTEDNACFVAVNQVYRLFKVSSLLLDNMTDYCNIANLERSDEELAAKYGIGRNVTKTTMVSMRNLRGVLGSVPTTQDRDR